MEYVVVALAGTNIVWAVCNLVIAVRNARNSPDSTRPAVPKPTTHDTLADAIEKCRRERAEMIQAVRDRDPLGYLTLADDGRLQFGNNMFVECFPPESDSKKGYYGIGYYAGPVARVTANADTAEEVIMKVAAELTRTLK